MARMEWLGEQGNGIRDTCGKRICEQGKFVSDEGTDEEGGAGRSDYAGFFGRLRHAGFRFLTVHELLCVSCP